MLVYLTFLLVQKSKQKKTDGAKAMFAWGLQNKSNTLAG